MATMTRGLFGEAFNPKNTVATVQYSGGSIMHWGCFGASETGALHKINGIMKNHRILQYNLKLSIR